MHISKILSVERTRCNVDATSKKRALEILSDILAGHHAELTERSVYDCLYARERLGSTGLGHGVALPHGRVASIPEGDDARQEPTAVTLGAFLKLRKPVDFDAPDGEKVDLIFGLIVPEESTQEHLEVLSELAQRFSDPSVRDALRAPIAPSDVIDVLAGEVPSHERSA